MNVNVEKFKNIYRALDHDLKEDYFIPLLKNAKKYMVGTGFFTLSGLAELIEVIIPIIKINGKIIILTSPLLQEEDVLKMKNSELTEKEIEEIIFREFSQDKDPLRNIELELKILAALIKENIIELKIVYSAKGIFHEKIGYVESINGDKYAYNGSANLTYSGLYSNIESVTSFIENRDDASIQETKEYLERLLKGEYQDIRILSVNNSIEQKLLTFQDDNESISSLMKKVEEKYKEKPSNKESKENKAIHEVTLRDYQNEAILQFQINNYVHFFEMATGTGKTYTALFALQTLQKKNFPLFTIIILPGIDLMYQWLESAKKSNIEGEIFALGGGANSVSPKGVFDLALNSFLKGENVTILSVSKSYQLHSEKFFTDYWSQIKDSLFIIIDESHNITEGMYSQLPKAKYRLGLSATPDRNNKEETDRILEYFRGKEYTDTFKYGLSEAIENNYLSKYFYYPIFVNLSEEEYELYEKETKKIASYMSSENQEDKRSLEAALQRRSLIVKRASQKMEKLSEMLNSPKYDFNSSVIYCGPGKIDEEIRMIDYVTNMVHEVGKYDVTKFVAETEDRENVLKEFSNGYYQTMVAIKCFDEGIDVPSLNRIYILSSDNNYRQTVQRRGRVLRVSKETGKEYADIFDFVVLPPLGVKYSKVKSLIKNEMARVIEYASLSENYEHHKYKIDSILEQAEINGEDVNYDDR